MTTRIPISHNEGTITMFREFFCNWRRSVSGQKIQDELAKVGAIYIIEKDCKAYLDFEREEDATMFILRWS